MHSSGGVAPAFEVSVGHLVHATYTRRTARRARTNAPRTARVRFLIPFADGCATTMLRTCHRMQDCGALQLNWRHGVSVKSFPVGYQYMMFFNTQRAWASDVNVRRAVSLAIDRLQLALATAPPGLSKCDASSFSMYSKYAASASARFSAASASFAAATSCSRGAARAVALAEVC